MMRIINSQTRLKDASYTIINGRHLEKKDVKGEIDDAIENLNDPEIRQVV